MENQPVQFGKRVSGRLEPMDINVVSLSTAGRAYEIQIQTEGIPDEQAAVSQLMTLEQQVPDLKILWINADASTGCIDMQFMDKGPGQFSFMGLASAIPAILAILFIVVMAILFWQLFATNPILLWALFVVGAGVAFYYIIKPSAPTQAIFGKRQSRTAYEKHDDRIDARQERKEKHENERLELEIKLQELKNQGKSTEGTEKKIEDKKAQIKNDEKVIAKLEKEKPPQTVYTESAYAGFGEPYRIV